MAHKEIQMSNFKLAMAMTFTILTLSSPRAFSLGNEGSGGGDLCESQIQIIRDDIASWIHKGGSKNLTLPEDLTESQYRSEMLKQIGRAKIRCIGENDTGYPIEVYGTPKVCRFDTSRFRSPTITCDRNAFMEMNETQQYVLIHHEYAGIAGLEKPNRDDSQYQISNQISAYLVDTVVKRLAVKPQTTSVPEDSLPLPFRGWDMLGGSEGVEIAKLIQDAVSEATFKDCEVIPRTIPTPSSETMECGGSKYYDISFDFLDGKSDLYNVPVGRFDCKRQEKGSFGYSLLASKNDNSIFKNLIYGGLLPREEDDEILYYETIYEFDSTGSKLKKVSAVRSKIVHVNVGTISTPNWKQEALELQKISCNAE
jgi:hypothetical protein